MKKIIVLVFLLSTILLNSEVITILPSSDCYTDVEHGDSPNVTGELWVANFVPAGQFQRIALDFDIDEYLDSNFQVASLKLTRFYSCPSGGSTLVRIYPISEEWNESNVDIHQHLAYHEDIFQEQMFSGTGGPTINQFNVDVSSIISQIIENNYDFHGLVMIANDNQKFSKFYSKEHANEADRPSLELTISPVSNNNAENVIIPLIITAYPNPFNPTTIIEFDNPTKQKAQINIYNLRGRLVQSIKEIEVVDIKNRARWNGKDLANNDVASGIYFCRVRIADKVAQQKLILQK